MAKRTLLKTPQEHFMRVDDEELAKFEHKEIAFQKADRAERAAKLRLPISRDRPRQPLRICRHDLVS
jgi:hypothetical protein